MKKSYVALIVIMILLSIVLVIGGTYAYYIATVSGNDLAEDLKITSGKMELTFDDGEDSLSLPNARPGDSASKDFTVENTSTIDSSYDYEYMYNIKLTEINVTFLAEDLEYTLEEYTDENYTDLKEDGVNVSGFINKDTLNEEGEMYLAIKITRPEISKKHYYRLTITFKKLEEVDQNYNQGATFSAKINIDDNKDAKLYVKVYKITTDIAKGTVEPNEMDVTEGEDSGVFTINPEDGYVVTNVACTNEQNAVLTENTFKVTNVTSDSECIVDISEGYMITTEVDGGHATITPPSQQVMPNMDTDTFTIDLEEGYGIKDITCTNDQVVSREGNTFKVTNVTSNSKCTIRIGEIYTISIPGASPSTVTSVAGQDSGVFTVSYKADFSCMECGGTSYWVCIKNVSNISCTSGSAVSVSGGYVIRGATSNATCSLNYGAGSYATFGPATSGTPSSPCCNWAVRNDPC